MIPGDFASYSEHRITVVSGSIRPIFLTAKLARSWAAEPNPLALSRVRFVSRPSAFLNQKTRYSLHADQAGMSEPQTSTCGIVCQIVPLNSS